jgi:LEA14-like dessication related protein
MKNKILLLFGVLLFFSSCKLNELQSPTVSRTENFKITKMSPDGIEGEITVNIKNPNSVGFTIFKSYFDVTYAGTSLGKAFMKKKIRIPANSDKTHTFQLKGSLKGVSMADLTKLMNGKTGQLEIAGKLKVGKWFYKKKFDVNHKQRISLSN